MLSQYPELTQKALEIKRNQKEPTTLEQTMSREHLYEIGNPLWAKDFSLKQIEVTLYMIENAVTEKVMHPLPLSQLLNIQADKSVWNEVHYHLRMNNPYYISLVLNDLITNNR